MLHKQIFIVAIKWILIRSGYDSIESLIINHQYFADHKYKKTPYLAKGRIKVNLWP